MINAWVSSNLRASRVQVELSDGNSTPSFHHPTRVFQLKYQISDAKNKRKPARNAWSEFFFGRQIRRWIAVSFAYHVSWILYSVLFRNIFSQISGLDYDVVELQNPSFLNEVKWEKKFLHSSILWCEPVSPNWIFIAEGSDKAKIQHFLCSTVFINHIVISISVYASKQTSSGGVMGELRNFAWSQWMNRVRLCNTTRQQVTQLTNATRSESLQYK